ncbi:MAG: thioesterase family protein [Myxococcota bacterium]
MVHELHIKYQRAAKLSDRLDVRSTVARSSPFRVTFDQKVYREGEEKPLVRVKVEVVAVDSTGTLIKLPEDLFV